MTHRNPEGETYGFFSVVDMEGRVSSLEWSDKHPYHLRVVGVLPHGSEIRPKTIRDAQKIGEWFTKQADRWGPFAKHQPNPAEPSQNFPKESDWPSSLPFGEDHTGTWIDAAYGPEHATQKLVGMLETVAELKHGGQRMPVKLDALITELEDANPDEISEIQDEAVEVLQDNTREGYSWEWEAGDLILYGPEEGE